MSMNGPIYHIRKIIDGKVYDTRKADRVLHLDCHRSGDDFRWENTDLHRTSNGRWFLSGRGNALSRWGTEQLDGLDAGDGIKLLNEDEAKAILEEHEGPYEAYFEVEEG